MALDNTNYIIYIGISIGGGCTIQKRGFTLVEIMIVVAIIGLVAAIALPSFINARKTAAKNACITNMKQIQAAMERWAIDGGAGTNATFATSDLVPNYLTTWPTCGTASYPVPATVSDTPTCPNSSVYTDHVLNS